MGADSQLILAASQGVSDEFVNLGGPLYAQPNVICGNSLDNSGKWTQDDETGRVQ